MIHQLTSDTISKIAAGEIIEEPASVVKELLENSIDAQSSQIQIEILNSPASYIRITDNGIGMSQEEIELSVLRHATSKIQSIEDLNNSKTLGFRGEALPSINQVSELEIISRSCDQDYAIRLVYQFGKKVLREKIGAPIGTTIKVKNIFENLPVRKKFLKASKIQWANIVEVVEKISLGVPGVSISLSKDHRQVFKSSNSQNHENHLYSILGKQIVQHLQAISFKSSSYKIQGFFGDNQLYRSSRIHEYIYINGRYVRNLQISKAIEGVYRSKIPLQKFPIFVLYIEIDPQLVDVNIHPKKHEVKLSNENKLIPILQELLSQSFNGSKIPDVQNIKNTMPQKDPLDILSLYGQSKKEDPTLKKEDIEEINFVRDDSLNKVDLLPPSDQDLTDQAEYLDYASEEEDDYSRLDPEKTWIQSLLETKYIGQIFKTYLLFQGKTDIYLIDQHAAHERILYEKYLYEFSNEAIDRQILLTPELIKTSQYARTLLENYQTSFQELGFVYDFFGEDSILLREVPFIFGEPGSISFIQNLIDHLSTVSNKYDFNRYDIMRKACRSAIKAHDPLIGIEVEALIQQLIACDDPYTCPHGRPSVLKISQRELEKLFLRVES
ncbi:DNA mismatch repair endonuclease MutL [Urinicoccus massiliensis]|uniref:DNA mismatch repair endonuclease MutL n=1 Tax=Urinicoccus massiliensis TaxID=1723382 RepID=UPI000930553C|nr:DNA mismatch repair endonuclease MutL [Urinicoccus massiliensis]